jgi:hypothetical protein
MKKQYKIYLLILVILINILFAYQPHFTYPYPLIADEYVHIALGKQLSENHILPFTNPYIFNTQKHFNLESGFHFFLATMFTIIPGEPVLYYKYFIPIFMIINSLLLFYLTSLLFKNYYISLLSVLFYGTIKSTGNFLAHNLFIPLTAGITLLLLSFIFFIKWEKTNNNKNLIYLLITLLAAAITYPPALTFFLGVITIYLLSTDHKIHQKFLISRKKFFTYLSTFLLISSTAIISILFFLNLEKFILFDNLWTRIQTPLSPIFFFGIIPTILAIIGIFTIIKANKNKLLISWIFFSLIQIYIFSIFNFTILVPFRRLFLFYLIGISILAAVGLIVTTNYIKKLNFKNKKLLIIIPIIIILSTHYYISFPQYNRLEMVSEEEYKAFQTIKQTYPKDTFIIANTAISTAITPITNMKIKGLIASNIAGGSPEEINKFFSGNCTKKIKVILGTIIHNGGEVHSSNPNQTRINPDEKILAISQDKISCSFLKEVHTKPYIYEVI